jgi:Na+-translocating ferredoxin:NAD+ oxidoreductase RnfC subunit
VNIVEAIQNAGVVGAGGAGFPAHIKARSRVDIVIANGAECEPLVHKDVELMTRHARGVVEGLRLVMKATGAAEGIIGVKEKNVTAIDALKAEVKDANIRLFTLGDFYPSGDEYILVYEATRRLIPPQGIPLNVGVVVNNVETLYNIARAAEGIPVTEKFLTVAGAVRDPVTLVVPIGTPFRDVLAAAGGPTARESGIFVGGIMMGQFTTDVEQTVTKTTAALLVLPSDHQLVVRRTTPEPAKHRIGKSACDQCTFCTELCPRYLLGYDVQPHKVMRSLGFTTTGEAFWNQYAVLCCACGLCTLYACPESLFPKEACDRGKEEMKARDITWDGPRDVRPHAMYEGRRTPVRQLSKKLGILHYENPAHLTSARVVPRKVSLPLQQHVGAPAQPVVRTGERVKVGQRIADIPEGGMGARLHASIDGIITAVSPTIVIEKA